MGCSSTKSDTSISLFEPYKLGKLVLKNRIIMSGMTRGKGDATTGTPTDAVAEYFSQRASAGLIITGSIYVSPRGNGVPPEGGLVTKEQAAAWSKVTKAVHAKGGLIFAQLYHTGRIGIPMTLGGKPPLAPSAIAINGEHYIFKQPYVVPEEMTLDQIKEVLGDFKKAAENAKEAGFDGVELYAGSGFLVDTFLKESSNKRTDQYGGSIEKRCRFALEVIDELVSVYGADRVGIKVTPVGRSFDMNDSDPIALFNYLFKKLSAKKIAYVFLQEANEQNEEGRKQIPNLAKQFRGAFKGTLIDNGGLTPEEAKRRVDNGEADLVAFATKYISNPDLVERLKNGWPLADVNWATLQGQGTPGYTDYPNYTANNA